jgi:hypothetical protein
MKHKGNCFCPWLPDATAAAPNKKRVGCRLLTASQIAIWLAAILATDRSATLAEAQNCTARPNPDRREAYLLRRRQTARSPDMIGRRVDPRGRRAEIGDPHRSRAYRDIAAVAWGLQSDRRNHLIGRRVDPRNGAISLIEYPDRAKTGSEKPGLWTHRNGGSDMICRRIDPGDQIL